MYFLENFQAQGGDFDVKSFLQNKFGDIPEVNNAFDDKSGNPVKYTYTYKTGDGKPVSTTTYANNFDDRFKPDFGKVNQVDFPGYGFGRQENKPMGMGGGEDQVNQADVMQTRSTRTITVTNGKKCIVEKKIYTMKDGSQKIVENQNFEN